jgi:Protein of unknown function (DUF1573)
MRKPVFLLIAILAAFAAASAPDVAAAPLRWQETTVSIEAPPLAESVEAAFQFTNTTARPVTITEIRSSCGCTVPQLEQKIYVPGESGTIRAVFTLGERVGQQEKTIMVTTAEPDFSSVVLTLRVSIPTLFEVTPFFVIWNVDEPPTPKSVKLRLVAPELLSLDSVTSRHTNFDATATAVAEDPNTRAVSITPRSTAQATNGGIEINLKAPDGRSRLVTIYAMIRQNRAPTPVSPPPQPAGK